MLAVEYLQEILAHQGSQLKKEDYFCTIAMQCLYLKTIFLPLLVADDHLQTEESTIGLFDVWHL